MLMRIPVYIKIVIIMFLFTVAGQATENRIMEPIRVPPPLEQPWESGATTVTLSLDGMLRVNGKGAMEGYIWIYDSLVYNYVGEGRKNTYSRIHRYPPWVSALWYGRAPQITAVVIEDGVTHIGKEAFAQRNRLTSVIIPNSVTSIGTMAFMQCTNLMSVTIPSSVTSIGTQAFMESGLTAVTIYGQKASIGERAFFNCANLTTITINDGVTIIGDEAFGHCANLTSVTINDGVTVIGDGAFWRCTSLVSITIPSSVISIGDGAFAGCANLKLISLQSPMPPNVAIDAFDDISDDAQIAIPRKKILKAYMTADGWKELLSESSTEGDGLWIAAVIIMAVIMLAAAGFVIIKRSRKTSVKSAVSRN